MKTLEPDKREKLDFLLEKLVFDSPYVIDDSRIQYFQDTLEELRGQGYDISKYECEFVKRKQRGQE